jgi:CRP/FNR family transcriptional regulator, cyclic AMP receptor protein
VKIHPIDLLVHFANVLLLISYSVRSMLWLRWFAVASALTVVPYYVAQEKILWPPVYWAVVFMTINVYQIARLYAARRPVVLSADDQKLYDLGFQALRPREFLSLVLIGEWKDGRAGDQVLSEGERVSAVSIAIAGTIEISRQGQSLAAMKPGHVIGTALALTDAPSPISASFTDAGRYIQWPISQLRVFLDQHPDLRLTLQRHVNRDLAKKLEVALSLGPTTN